jgi:hypothetical protein
METVLLAGLVLLAVVATAAVIGSLFRAALWILILPFRIVGWVLYLPLLLLKIVAGVLTPVTAVVAAVLAAVVAGVFVPLVPVLVIAAFVWLVVKMSRPSRRDVPSRTHS